VDVLIPEEKLRNRSLSADVVCVVIDNPETWELRRTLQGGGASSVGGYSSAASERRRKGDPLSRQRTIQEGEEEDDESEEEEMSAVASKIARAQERASKAHPIPAVARMYEEGTVAASSAAGEGSESEEQRLWRPRVDVRSSVATDASMPAESILTVNPFDKEGVDRIASTLSFPATINGYPIPTVTPAMRRAVILAGAHTKAGTLQPTGRVVAIFERKHSMTFVGTLSSTNGAAGPIPASHKFVRLEPLNNADPWVLIPASEAPKEFLEAPHTFSKRLFAAVVDASAWSDGSRFPIGHLKESLGESGDIVSDLRAILRKYEIDDAPFSDGVHESLRPVEEAVAKAGKNGWRVPADEIRRRRDLRSERIFTIDPTTAKVGAVASVLRAVPNQC
jgi:exoribonuclease R